VSIFLKNYFVSTTGEIDFIPIIHDVRFAIRDSKIQEGLVTISMPGEAAHILICKEDAKKSLQEKYKTLEGSSYTSQSIPFKNRELLLNPKQAIYLVDLSDQGKRREFHVQVFGESPPERQRGGRPGPRRQRR